MYATDRSAFLLFVAVKGDPGCRLEFSGYQFLARPAACTVFDDGSGRIIKPGKYAPVLVGSASVMRPCDADATGTADESSSKE
jgi:hypothetical protein